jgi:hypothetical protein
MLVGASVVVNESFLSQQGDTVSKELCLLQ